MKKLLSIVISLIMILGATTLFACDATFDGNYKKADAEQTKAFLNEMEESAEKSEEPAATTENLLFGMEMSLNLSVNSKMNGESRNAKVTANAKSTVVGEDNDKEFKLAAKAEISGNNEEIPVGKYEAYATDGKIYFSMAKQGEAAQKAYVSLSYEELQGMLGAGALTEGLSMGEMSGYLSIATSFLEAPASLQAMFESSDAVKFYLDTDAKKIKVDINGKASFMQAMAIEVKGAIYAAFGDNGNLVGIKVDLNAKVSADANAYANMGVGSSQIDASVSTAGSMEINVNFLLKAYDGAVNVPANFEGYEEEDLDTIMEAVMG